MTLKTKTRSSEKQYKLLSPELLVEVKKHRSMYLFLLPAIVAVIIFSYLPMFGLVMAFQDYKLALGFASPFNGIENFKAFLTNPDFYRALKNTLGINIINILVGFPLPIVLALLTFNLKKGPCQKIFQSISYLPHFISWVVMAGLVYRILDVDTGIVNLIIGLFGQDSIAFMRETDWFWFVTITTQILKEVGWDSIIYLAALSAIDVEQYEAAHVEGATGFQKLIYITLPNLAPTIALMLILTMGKLVSGGISFDAIYNLRNPLVATAADTLDYFIFEQGVKLAKYGMGTAMGLVQGAITFALVFIANKISKKLNGYGAF